ncbi:aldehyde dehydrogenase family protein [Anditalea andensis]|uniref:Aldehyde dehydrogenase n=1 Tax=Anditalea andensis TaxID=1048983 RepID=A0A074L028_9BACT|nr:aldehyde dehydrogenase family protein [Anditalea andensis]KEO73213.1 aldehyde dehydrogenase [Anditalea andensis]
MDPIALHIQANVDLIFNKQRHHALQLRLSTKEERLIKLKKLQTWIRKNIGEIRNALYADLKKPSVEVDLSETYVVLAEINLAIKNLGKWMQPTKVNNPMSMAGIQSYIQYEPKGTSLIISPWNFPFQLAITPLVSAIAAGCTAIIKPSEMSVHTSALLSRMVAEVFAVEEVALFQGEVNVAEMLLQKPFEHIFFTGSPSVGKTVMKAAAEHLASVTLELGGKSPAIIDKGTNLDDAAQKIAWGKFMNSGQTCIAPDYLLVNSSILDSFLVHLKAQIIKMYDPKGKGIHKSKDYARIINGKNLKRISRLLNDALLKGAVMHFGGEIIEEECFIAPTVLTHISEEMDIMNEEIFGPLLPIIPYENIKEIPCMINSKPKPLAMYVFSNEAFVMDYILSHTSAGGVCINDTIVHYLHPELPFGGVNNSGIGKSHGYHGFLAFSNQKSILKQKTGFTTNKMLYPPYGFAEKKISEVFIKLFG